MAIKLYFTTLILAILVSLNTTAQIDFHWEPVAYHDYQVGDPLYDELNHLNGYITWQLFIEFNLDDDDDSLPEYVYSILGNEENLVNDFKPLRLNFSCCPYQDPNGGPTADTGANSPDLIDLLFPSLEYDSWVTIGEQYESDFSTGITPIEDPGDPWVELFEEGCDDLNPSSINIDSFTGGGWILSTPYNSSNSSGLSDPDFGNRVLIGQFTLPIGCNLVTDVFPAQLCLDYFVDVDTTSNETYQVLYDSVTECVTLTAPDPCFANPIFPSLVSQQNVLCKDSLTGLVQVESVLPEAEVSISIDATEFTDEGYGIFGGLAAGTHEITFTNLLLDDLEGNSCTDSIIVVIEEPEEGISGVPTVVTPTQCAGDPIGVVSIAVTGGTPFTVGEPYTVTSDVGSISSFTAPNIFEFSGLDVSTGIEFTILDSTSCEFMVTQAMGPEGALTVDSEFTDVSCFGDTNGTITLTIVGGEDDPTVTWTDQDANPLVLNDLLAPTGLAPGIYNVNVDDGVNCDVDVEFIIGEPDVIEITSVVITDLSCFEICDGEITVVAEGGIGTLDVSLLQNGVDVVSGSLCALETVIRVEDENGCQVDSIVTLEQNPEIFFNALVTDIQCPAGCDGIIDLSDREGGSGVSTPTISPLIPFDIPSNSYIGVCASLYDITLTDELGCTNDTTIFMTAPAGFVTNSSFVNVTCNGFDNGSLMVSANGGTGVITYCINSNPCNETGEFTDLAPGDYIITGTDEGGCPFEFDDPITISEPTVISITDLTISPPGCGGEATAAAFVTADGGTPGYLYAWNGNAPGADSSLGGLAAGDNTLQIIDQNDCVKDTIFEIAEPLPITIVINSQDVTCTGMCDGSFTVAAIAIEPYNVNFGGIPTSDVCEGEYPIVVTDGLGCIARDTVVIESVLISDIEYTVFTTPVSCWEESDGTATVAVTGGEPPIEYSWSDINQNQTTATAVGLVEDFYTVTITDALGCTFTEEFFIDPTIGCFFVADALTPNGDGFNDDWVIGGLEYFQDAKVEVFNRWGQQVFESLGSYTPWDGKLNSNRLPVADYYYVITFDTSSPPLTGTVTLKY